MPTTETMQLEIRELKTVNTELSSGYVSKKLEISRLNEKVKSLTVPVRKQEPFDTRQEAKDCVDLFRNATEIEIPQSIMFDCRNLSRLTEDDSIYPFVRFYMGAKEDPNTHKPMMTLVAVGVTKKNKDEDREFYIGDGKTTTLMYEFADPCPKCTIDDTYQQVEGLLYEKELPCRYIFEKTGQREDCPEH